MHLLLNCASFGISVNAKTLFALGFEIRIQEIPELIHTGNTFDVGVAMFISVI